jgi:hypothetical protein
MRVRGWAREATLKLVRKQSSHSDRAIPSVLPDQLFPTKCLEPRHFGSYNVNRLTFPIWPKKSTTTPENSQETRMMWSFDLARWRSTATTRSPVVFVWQRRCLRSRETHGTTWSPPLQESIVWPGVLWAVFLRSLYGLSRCDNKHKHSPNSLFCLGALAGTSPGFCESVGFGSEPFFTAVRRCVALVDREEQQGTIFSAKKPIKLIPRVLKGSWHY